MNTECDNPGTVEPQLGRSILLAMSWYDHRIHLGISRFAKAHGWRVDARMANSTEMAWGWKGDGVITKLGCSTLDTEIRDFVLGLGCPAIDLSVFGPTEGIAAIEFDPLQIGRQAAAHFIERGFRRFAWFPDIDQPPIRLRREGFEQALAEEGFGPESVARILTGEQDSPWEHSERWLGERLRSMELPVGVLCFNDEWGSRILRACEGVGLRVPQDVAVLGVDNNELVCEHLSVPLSSVALDFESWGTAAANRLAELMELPADQRPVGALELMVPRGIVTRQSTDTLAISHPDVARAARFIAENYGTQLSASDVIVQGRLSGSGLKQAFRTHLRRSISDEIQRVRFEAVQKRLRTTDWTLDRIAQDCGLGNVRNLHRLFAKHESDSPSNYRKRAQLK